MRMETKTLNKAASAEWKTQLIRLPWVLLIPFGMIVKTFVSRHPAMVERLYSQGLYPILNRVLNSLFGILPASFAELLFLILMLSIPALFVYTLIGILLKRLPWSRLTGLILTFLIVAGVTFNAFYLLWGFNYSRPPLGVLLELDVRERQADELEHVCFSLAQKAVQLRELVPEDENGIFKLPNSAAAYFEQIPKAYENLRKSVPLFSMRASKPKPAFASKGLSWAGISGVYSPFTAEPNVNTHQPALLIPAAAAHECAHGLGIAREDEANFVAYLACMASNDPVLMYSGIMLALVHAGNELYNERPDAFKELFKNIYSEDMRRDVANYNSYWNAYKGPVEEAVTKVNDGYLKYNHQESGVKSYGEMVDLLLAWVERVGITG